MTEACCECSVHGDPAAEIRVGPWVLDVGASRLYKGGRHVDLTAREVELLTILMTGAPAAYANAELKRRLWKMGATADDALYRLVSNLRLKLHREGAYDDCIRTVERFGYSFSVEPEAGADTRMTTKVRIGPCVFDRDSHRFYLRGVEVCLRPKLFKLLEVLLDQAPRAVSKAELRQQLWPDTFVSDDALARLVSALRAAMDDRASPRIVRTVSRYGYALDHESLDGQVGTSNGSRAAVERHESTSSRVQARIVIADGVVHVEDCGSEPGTYVGDRRVDGMHPLHDGDVVSVGSCVFAFTSPLARSHSRTVIGRAHRRQAVREALAVKAAQDHPE